MFKKLINKLADTMKEPVRQALQKAPEDSHIIVLGEVEAREKKIMNAKKLDDVHCIICLTDSEIVCIPTNVAAPEVRVPLAGLQYKRSRKEAICEYNDWRYEFDFDANVASMLKDEQLPAAALAVDMSSDGLDTIFTFMNSRGAVDTQGS